MRLHEVIENQNFELTSLSNVPDQDVFDDLIKTSFSYSFGGGRYYLNDKTLDTLINHMAANSILQHWCKGNDAAHSKNMIHVFFKLLDVGYDPLSKEVFFKCNVKPLYKQDDFLKTAIYYAKLTYRKDAAWPDVTIIRGFNMSELISLKDTYGDYKSHQDLIDPSTGQSAAKNSPGRPKPVKDER